MRINQSYLIATHKLIVETDAKYIQGMLQNPDLMPNATINRWIDEISIYHFTLRHKAGKTFGPGSLSRRKAQPGDPEVEPCSDDEEIVLKPLKIEIADPSKP